MGSSPTFSGAFSCRTPDLEGGFDVSSLSQFPWWGKRFAGSAIEKSNSSLQDSILEESSIWPLASS